MEHLFGTRVLVGDVVADAIGATEDKMEEFERRNECTSRGIAGKGTARRAIFGSYSERNLATK